MHLETFPESFEDFFLNIFYHFAGEQTYELLYVDMWAVNTSIESYFFKTKM